MSKIFKIYIRIILLFFIFFIFIGNKKSSISLNNNSKMFNIIKHKLQGLIKNNIDYIDSLYIVGKYSFGNFIISINNAIIFCEFFHCKRIIIKSYKDIFINNTIFYTKYNLTIEHNSNITYNNYSLKQHWRFFYYQTNFRCLGKVNRLHILREEIISNLPKVKVHPDDLYIYIRGGDIFKKQHANYAQPPLCFYRSILNRFNFRVIRIISQDRFNPILTSLEQLYYVKFVKNNIKLDISYLASSYNIISAISSFIISIIKLNNNLKFLWEYDFYHLSERYLHLHYSVYTFSFKYIIYLMKASDNYKKLMFHFINSKRQMELMIKEKCYDKFYLIPPRLS